MRSVPRLCEFNPGICLTTEEKHGKTSVRVDNHSQGSSADFVTACLISVYGSTKGCYSRSQWPYGLRRSSAAARLLRLWVRVPPGAWMSVCCECCVLIGRGLCDELISRPEESYWQWCVLLNEEGPGLLEAVGPKKVCQRLSLFSPTSYLPSM